MKVLNFRVFKIRMKNGYLIRLRLDEVFTLYEVWVRQDYLYEDVSWSNTLGIFDIGANVGISTLWLADKAPSAQIIAVEPDRSTYMRLLENLSANIQTRNVTALCAAAGAIPGEGVLVKGRASAVNTVRSRSRDEQLDSANLVEILSFGALVARVGFVPTMLKLDCEGAEYPFLLNCSKEQLAKVRCLLLEYHSGRTRSHQELLLHLRLNGFRVPRDSNSECGIIVAQRD